MKVKGPPVPAGRLETVRQEIISSITGQRLSAKEISGRVRVREKEVYLHLDHIQKTIQKHDLRLIITPSECKKCGFIFKKRDRLKKPGKCPICRHESITEPLFIID